MEGEIKASLKWHYTTCSRCKYTAGRSKDVLLQNINNLIRVDLRGQRILLSGHAHDEVTHTKTAKFAYLQKNIVTGVKN